MDSMESISTVIVHAMRQWAFSLPMIVVWISGIAIAIGRRRRCPRAALLVIVSCGLSLLVTIVMPVLMQLSYTFMRPFGSSMSIVSLGVSGLWSCFAAVSAGLLVYAAFVDRPEYRE